MTEEANVGIELTREQWEVTLQRVKAYRSHLSTTGKLTLELERNLDEIIQIIEGGLKERQ